MSPPRGYCPHCGDPFSVEEEIHDESGKLTDKKIHRFLVSDDGMGFQPFDSSQGKLPPPPYHCFYCEEEVDLNDRFAGLTPKIASKFVGEFQQVLRMSRDMALLVKLEGERASQDRCLAVVEYLCERFDIKRPRITFTGRTDRGTFFADRIVVRGDMPVMVETLLHELAHHWLWFGIKGGRWVPDHGMDFTMRLDQLAAAYVDYKDSC